MSYKKIGNWDFNKLINELKISKIPEQIGDIAQKHFKKNFDDEGFDGVKWSYPWRKLYGKGAKRTNPVLTDSGALRKSIKVIKATWDKIIVGTVGNKVNDYAEKHNEGIGVDKRQFIGESSELDRKIDQFIEKELEKLFK